MADRYDIVIVGGGTAGFTAGIYAARDRCRALLVERLAPGGQVLNSMRTPVPGVLAAGDLRRDSARQVVSSAGDGATAALAAVRYLRTGRWDVGRMDAVAHPSVT